MKIFFCSDALRPRSVDSSYERESIAAAQAGLAFELLDFSAIRKGNEEASVRFVSASDEPVTAVYRGWMLTPPEYGLLHDALTRRNIHLINSPEQYLHCHWLPESYSTISGYTPRSVWMSISQSSWNLEIITADLKQQFGSSPVIVKDYVKSRKHEWKDACFIPDASDHANTRRIVENFIERQGEDLQAGLVFREFVEFEPIGIHPKSGMPLTLEYRLFVMDGVVIAESPYWEGQTRIERPPVGRFQELLNGVQSRFFTCDVAKTKQGEWLIMELGDGQAAGLPELCDMNEFYDSLVARSVGR